jgi:hypothetical protein
MLRDWGGERESNLQEDFKIRSQEIHKSKTLLSQQLSGVMRCYFRRTLPIDVESNGCTIRSKYFFFQIGQFNMGPLPIASHSRLLIRLNKLYRHTEIS